MASGGRKKTTFEKLARESRLRERRLEKQAKKEARKRAADTQLPQSSDKGPGEDGNARAHASRDGDGG